MAESLRQRLDLLRRVQNDDGGWGYFPGRRSWLEPTAYAMLALDGRADRAALEGAWRLLESWQLPDGSWRPGADVAGPGTWVTALGVHLCCLRGKFDDRFTNGVRWLLSTQGREGNWLARVMAAIQPTGADNDLTHHGWPWLRGTSSWVEPTAQTIVALRLAAAHYPGVEARVRDAEELILTRKCRDGGWNYGSRRALGIDLPSYPETTALALLGLQARGGELGAEIAHARGLLQQTRSRLARAWLSIALRNLGEETRAPDGEPDGDILLAGLEAMAHPEGNRTAFRVPREAGRA
ncbi:MAG: prenyltransferase/squalene oxidase repeat-containing protein [Bryobacteraceae bacterium]|jgi:hypothetical protein